MKVNMTQYCKENDISSFSRTRGGWFKQIERFDESARGGYAFVGSNFIKVGNFNSIIPNGLYIDCSKHFINNKIKEVINIFEVQSNTIKLLQSGNKGSKWAYNFFDTVKNWFSNNKDTNQTQEIIDAIKSITNDEQLIANAFEELLQNNKFRNKYEVKMLLQSNDIVEYPFMFDEYIEDKDKILQRTDFKYKGGFAISDNDCNRIGHLARKIYHIDLNNCNIVCENIEPFKLKTKNFYDNLKEIGDVDNTGIHTINGYCINNKRTNRYGCENRNNLLIVTCNKETNTIFVKYCDIWCDWLNYW